MRREIKIKHPILFRLSFIVISLMITTLVGLNLIGNSMNSTIFEIAELQTKKIATLLINRAVDAKVIDKIDQETVLIVSKQDNGKVASLSFNTNILNKVMVDVTDSIQKNLKYIEKGEIDKVEYPDIEYQVDIDKLKKGIMYEIPYGIAFNYPLLANVGPYIPVRFSLIGGVSTNLRSVIQNYGVNNVLIEVVATINIKTRIIIPLSSSLSELEVDIPIAMSVIQGEVPIYYQGSYKVSDSGLAIPIS